MYVIRKLQTSELYLYERVPMILSVTERLAPVSSVYPFRFRTVPAEFRKKDLGKYFSLRECAETFGIEHWAFFLAEEEGKPIGAATLACRTEKVDMLEKRNDLCVLWDIRVREDHRRSGVGSALFAAAAAWARTNGYTEMKIESQDNNVPAYSFYLKQGAVLTEINQDVYREEECKDELQFIWRLKL